MALAAQTSNSSQQLQQLIDAEAAAKQSGDASQVFATSQKLIRLAAAEIKATRTALKQPHLTPVRTQRLRKREQQLREVLGDGYNDCGTAEARQQQYEHALLDFQRAEKWNPATPGLPRNLGTAAFRLERYPEAVHALTSVVAQAPNDQRSRLMLAMSLFSMERFADAAQNFAPIGDLTMQDPRTAYAWAYSLAHVNQLQHTNEIADNLSNLDLPPDIHILVCKLYTTTENYEHALSCLKNISAQFPKMTDVHYETGATLVHMGRSAEAIPELRAELTLDPQDIDAKYYLAYALLETSHRDEGIQVLEAVIAEQPKYSLAQYQLGKALLEEGKITQAVPHLEIAVKLNPSADFMHYQMQMAYRRAGRSEDANRELELYKQLKASHRDTGGAHETTATTNGP
ncbi:MAG TPA: tetratricopeptide repeat protein [Terracidiphilus sp.]